MPRKPVWIAVLAVTLGAAAQSPQTGTATQATATETPGAGQAAAASSEADAAKGSTNGDTSAKVPKHAARKHDRATAAKLYVDGAKDVENDRIRAAVDAFTRAAE